MLFISNKYFLMKDSVNTSRWVFSAFVCKRDDRKKGLAGKALLRAMRSPAGLLWWEAMALPPGLHHIRTIYADAG